MKKRVGAADGDYELIRSAQVYLRHMQSNGFVVRVNLRDTGRLGAIEIDCAAEATAPNGAPENAARYRVEWPNSTPQTFAGCIFQAMMKLSKMTEDYLESPF